MATFAFHLFIGALYGVAATMIYCIGYVRGFKRGAKTVDEMIHNQLDNLIAELGKETEQTKPDQNT